MDSEVSSDLSSCFVVGEGSVWDMCWVVTDVMMTLVSDSDLG